MGLLSITRKLQERIYITHKNGEQILLIVTRLRKQDVRIAISASRNFDIRRDNVKTTKGDGDNVADTKDTK